MQADKNNRDDDFSQGDECQIDLLTGEHVCPKTNGKGKRSCEVADGLDREHQRRQQQHGSKKLLDIAASVLFDSREVIKEECQNGKSQRNHGIHGWRFKPWDQPDYVQKKDEYKYGSEEGEVLYASVSDHFFGGGAEELVGEFQDVLDFAGLVDGEPGRHDSEEDQDEKNDQNLASHPVGPGMSGVIRRVINGMQDGVGQTAEQPV